MSSLQRERMVSQTSSSSSDSYCIDPSHTYDRIDGQSYEDLIQDKGEKSSVGRGNSPLVVVSFVISVFCLVVLLGSLLFFYFQFSYSSDEFGGRFSEEGKVCMPCDQIVPDPLADVGKAQPPQGLNVSVGEDGDTEICCASTPAQYALLFKLILRRQEEVKKLADILGRNNATDSTNDRDDEDDNNVVVKRAVSSHLLAKPALPHQLISKQAVQRWKTPDESPVSHVLGGLQLHNNTLLVRTPGLFYIYCQILFNREALSYADSSSQGAGKEAETHVAQVASHYVKRDSLLYPASSGILLKARHTRMSGQNDRHSSYVGGLFFLRTGDRLFVHVTAPRCVSHDDRASFFGMFKVGN